MGNKDFLGVYPYSAEEAKRLGELDAWRESFRENIACKNAIEEAIRGGFDGMHLSSECAKTVIAEFGYHRVAYILANTLQEKDFDGRFSHDNRDWAKRTYIPADKEHRYQFVADSHPAVLDGFVNQYRRAYQELGLFDHAHCLPDTGNQDFEGKVIVLKAECIRESCLTPQSQLWLCRGGFGANPDASGRAVLGTCLADGETVYLNRADFAGVLAEANLPDWAQEKLTQLRGDGPEQSPGMGGMTMQ